MKEEICFVEKCELLIWVYIPYEEDGQVVPVHVTLIKKTLLKRSNKKNLCVLFSVFPVTCKTSGDFWVSWVHY